MIPSVLHPRRRYRVTGTFVAEVDAQTDDDAIMGLRVVHEGKTLEERFHHTEATELPYAAWVSERWRSGCAAIRFAEQQREDGVPHAVRLTDVLGCWWATNGHVALRCDGDPPDGLIWVPERTLSALLTAPTKPAESWARTEETWRGDVYAQQPSKYTISLPYLYLVESGRPTRWEVPDDRDAPCAAYDGEQLIAIVMPTRWGGEAEVPADQSEHRQTLEQIRGDR